MARKLTSGRRLAAALMSGGLLVGALTVLAAGPAEGVATPVPANVKAYATGTELHVHALQVAADGPRVADVHQAHSAATFNSSGLPAGGQVSEINATISPIHGALDEALVPAGSEAYARGAGIDVGLGNSLPNATNEAALILSGIAGAASYPPATSAEPVLPAHASTQTGLVEEQIDVPVSPLVYAGVLRGRALANWNPNHAMPMLGSPIAYGEGYAADVQLLNAGDTQDPQGRMLAPVIATDAIPTGTDRSVADSKSYTYLVNNGDGTCGVATEIHQTIAPVRINLPPDDVQDNDLIIEVAGEWVMRGVATGKAPATVSYAVGDADISLPIIRVIQGAAEAGSLNFEDLFGEEGLDLLDPALDPLLNIDIAEPPRAPVAPGVTPVFGSAPTKTVNQLRVAADAVRVQLLSAAAGTPEAGLQALDLRLGHFEMSIDVPTGGVNCEIPIDKSGPPSIDIGTNGVFTVKVPIDAAALNPFPCKLTSITVTDVVAVETADTPSRPPVMNILSGTGPAGSTATVSADKKSITFTNVPNYTPGSPPLTFTITGQVPTTSGQGKIRNTATATAVPGDCQLQDALVGSLLGGAAFFGSSGAGLTGRIEGASSNNVTGSDVVGGIGITAGRVLAVTGRNDGLYLGLALAALAAGFGAVRLRRRATVTE